MSLRLRLTLLFAALLGGILLVGTPGEWRALAGEIEGYTHRAGERNVLRVKRFERSHPPADASRFVYVLDLVVESEIVQR